MVNFKVSKADAKWVGKIVDRAVKMARANNADPDPLTLSMDLTACHCNGCPLRLADLAAAPDFDFAHDVFGISRHIDRKTGRMADCFVPRYAARQDGGEED